MKMKLTAAAGFSAVAFALSAFAEVPDSFVEYIASDGNAWVDTGVKPNPRTTRAVITLAPTVVNNTEKSLFGQRSVSAWGGADATYALLNSSQFRVDWVAAQTKVFTPTVNEVYRFDCLNDTVLINDVKTTSGKTKTNDESPYSFYLFAMNSIGTVKAGLAQRLYSARIYADGTALSAGCVPCVKGGVAGLYDLVSGEILYDQSGKSALSASDTPNADYVVEDGVVKTKLTVAVDGSGGSTEETSRWVPTGRDLELSATPDSGMRAIWDVIREDGTELLVGSSVTVKGVYTPVSVRIRFFPADWAYTVKELEAAVEDAQEGDMICLAPGTFELTKTLENATGFTLQGAGRDETILTAAKIYGERAVHLGHAKAMLKNLTVTGANAQLNGAGIYMVNGTLDNVRVYNNYQRGNGDNYNKGAGVYMETGVITNSLVDYNFLKAGYHGSSGLGIYMKGGLVVDSEICHNWMDRNQHNGIGVWANAGTIRRCRIYDNYSTKNTSIGGSGVVNMSSGHGAFISGSAVLEDSLVYSNGWNGVMMTGANSVIRNCLVFGHRQGTADYFAGVNMSNGLLVNCTITDNCALGDTTGKSGLWQTGGTAINNIIYGNGLAALGSCCVTGGTFDHNVTDFAVAGGTVGDPKFADAANGDYHLTGASTVAIDKGLEREDVPYDLDGIARPQKNAWDVGCYEYVPDTKPSAAISIDQPDYPGGETLTATAVTENIDEATAKFTWKLSGAVTYTFEGVGEEYKTFAYPEAAVGAYELSLVVTAGGADIPAAGTETFTVRPTTVYVDLEGGDEYPYNEPDKAARSVQDAFDAVWRAEGDPGLVIIAEGTYPLTSGLVVSQPCVFVGAGRDDTILDGSALVDERGFNLSGAGTVLRDLMVTGCSSKLDGTAILMGAGTTLDNVRVTGNNHLTKEGNVGALAAGIYMTGGTVTNCLVDANTGHAGYDGTKGIGIYMTDGLLIDSVVCSNKFDRNQHSGVGVCAEGGTVRRCRIFGNESSVNDKDTHAHGLYVSGSDTLVEDCLVYSNGWCGVQLSGGTMRNCVIFGHKANNNSDFWAGAYVTGGKLQNCTLYDNVAGGDSTGKSGLYQTGGTVENCIVWASTAVESLGGCQVTGGTFRNNISDKPIALGTDCIVADPQFVGAAAGDFHLAKSSPAIDAGCEIAPFETDADGNPVDIEGVIRPQKDAWDIGAYEYVPGTDPVVSIVAAKVGFPLGGRLEATAATENIDEGSATFAWTLRDQDGETVTEQIGTGVEFKAFAFSSQSVGLFELSLVVTDGGTPIAAGNTITFTVKPTETFVATTGSHKFPFDSWATAATNLNEAVVGMWMADDSTGLVHVAAGDYQLSGVVTLNAPLRIMGAGRDETVLHGQKGSRGFYLSHRDAEVSDLTLTGCTNSYTWVGAGVRMEKGLLRNVRITKTLIADQSGEAVASGIYLSGGVVTNCLIDANACHTTYGWTEGMGVYMTGGTLVDSVICSNWVNRCELRGIGVRMTGGTIRRCDIFRNTGLEDASKKNSYGMNLYADGSGMVEDCHIHDGLSGVQTAEVNGGPCKVTFRNCLICGHASSHEWSAGLVAANGTKVVNCTIAGNTCTDETKGDATFASGTMVTNTIAVAASVGDEMKGAHNSLNTPVAFKRGYRLKGNGNPCVNAGDNAMWEGVADPKDLDGKARIREGIVDLGCFEHEPTGLSVFVR